MKISVIIPAYNCEEYLAACLESVIHQTYRDIEIILIDDGSTDNTAKICDEYGKRFPEIKVIHQSNGGVSRARNVGIQYISGDAVSFIDADDTLDLDMYEILMATLIKYDADIVHCGYKHIVGDEIRLVHNTGIEYVQSRQEALGCLVEGRLFGGGLWNKLIKVKLIDGLRFRENLKNNEDILFAFEIFDRSKVSVFVDLAKYNYIAHIGTSAVYVLKDVKKNRDAVVVSKIMYERLAGESLQESARERYLRALSGLYRCTSIEAKERKTISKEMWKTYIAGTGVSKKMKITMYGIRFCPSMYLISYRIYNRLRKPNWEVS